MNRLKDAFSDPPPPYTMCSREECEARQRTGEISLFERKTCNSSDTSSSSTAQNYQGSKPQSSLQMALKASSAVSSSRKARGKPSSLAGKTNSSLKPSTKFSNKSSSCAQKQSSSCRHTIDPRLAVSKYRRSAAGVTDRDRPPPRTVHQLFTTVRYLQGLLISSPTKSSDQSTPIDSWLLIVNFVEDRLRAVQVDLVVTGQASKALQYQATRTYILILYLMVDVKDYSQKFGKDALQAAMANYWNDPVELARCDDEMLSYALLLQCNIGDDDDNDAVTRRNSFFSFSELFRKHVPTCSKNTGPFFQWSLQFVVACQLGQWHKALRQLDQGCLGDADFDVMARCCLASQLPQMRWKALQTYNLSWGKGEAVAAAEVARMLCLEKSKHRGGSGKNHTQNIEQGGSFDAAEVAALSLCQSAGLPLDEETRRKIRFKVSPIQPLKQQKGCPGGTLCRDDGFVCRYGPKDGPLRRTHPEKNGFDIPPLKWMETLLFRDC